MVFFSSCPTKREAVKYLETLGHASIGTHLNRGRTKAELTYFATVAAFLLRLLLPSSTHLQPPLVVGCATRSVVCNGGGWG
jgi:hypothetical protein